MLIDIKLTISQKIPTIFMMLPKAWFDIFFCSSSLLLKKNHWFSENKKSIQSTKKSSPYAHGQLVHSILPVTMTKEQSEQFFSVFFCLAEKINLERVIWPVLAG